jgi:hypothetical protein
MLAIIERSAIDGQRQYHSDLETAMLKYISEHETEFLPEGADALELDTAAAEAAAEAHQHMTPAVERSPEEVAAERVREVEQRGLQWAFDTVTNASKVASESFWGAMDILGDVIGDLRESKDRTSWITGIVIFLLVVSNLWSIVSLRDARSRNEMTLKQMESRKYYHTPATTNAGGGREDDREKMTSVAADAVKVFWEGLMAADGQQKWSLGAGGGAYLEEAKELRRSVERLEERLARLESGSSAPPPIDRVD